MNFKIDKKKQEYCSFKNYFEILKYVHCQSYTL